MRAKKRTHNRQKSYGRKSDTSGRATLARAANQNASHEVFARNLRRARRRNQLSLEQLAGKADLPLEFVKSVERGDALKIGHGAMEAFATALGLEIEDLTKGCVPGGV